MLFLKQVPASYLAITPYYIKNKESRGFWFSPPNHHGSSEAVGAQCAVCNTIIWITGRWHPILNRKMQHSSGEKYREEYRIKIKDFLNSLPECPDCHHQKYDLFINNIGIPRLQDGSLLDENDELINAEIQDKREVLVWWFGSKEELERLKLG